MKVFILLSVIAVAFASRQCGENQHYESCGTACPLTCENYANPPRACILMCNPGCHCDQGYVKTQDGRCVRPEECPADAEPLVKTCLGKPDPGMCRGYFPAWYYDVQTEKCHQFIYGGCQGNGNRYDSEEECLNHCGDLKLRESSAKLCELEFETGPCRAFIPRYYFDKKSGQCKKFVYGGCGGNENNFETVESCNQACGARQQASAEHCELPAVIGPCRGAFPRFYFDKKTGKCEKFIYGGCGANENNFETEDVCNLVCGARQQTRAEFCELPAVTGPCRGAFPSFYFDKKTGQCEKFIYGGCGGNKNNFESEDVCNEVCGTRQEARVGLCQLPAETGPCMALFHRFYFDESTGKCEKFIYGGCRGNENNFKTEEECKQICA